MKVCFLQREAFPYFGIMSLAGSLKTEGIASAVLIDSLERDTIASLRALAPDLLGISVLTTEHVWLRDIAKTIRRNLPSTRIVVGGVHAILYPDSILDIPEVDYVCTGEGENTLLSLCRHLQGEEDGLEKVRGLAFRKGTDYIFNEQAPFLELNNHREDRTLYYDRYPELRDDELRQFIASRGCPFKCTFCFNEEIRNKLKSTGSYVRRKTPNHLLEEISQVRAAYGMGSIFFADDLFTMNKSWLREFLPLYKKQIGAPFMCTTRADLMDDEIAALLKDNGCHTVSFGIESGSEKLRNELLGKGIMDRDIARCASVLKKHGIKIQTSNMFCLPGETLQDAFSTVDLNIAIKTDYAFATIFMPFPDTRLAQKCIQQGHLRSDFSFKDLPKSFLTRSILILPDKTRIENVQKCSFFMIKYPVLAPLFRKAITAIASRWLYYPFIFIGTFLRYKEERRISFASAVKYLWRFRKSW